MKNVLLQQAIKLTKQYRRRKHWQQFVRITAAAVVFVTTYALVLPAITMEKETLCGQQEHTHTEECYTDKTVWLMHCTLKADKDIVVLHTHQDHCYTAEGALICQIVERTGHTHDDSCYGAPECICQIPEGEGHTHSESCTTGIVLTCELPESPGHTHDDTCAVTEQVLICGTQETPGHSHSESCITTVTEMTCTEEHEHTEQCSVVTEVPCALEETEGHTHGEGCYETRTVPCAQEESQGHSHTETCYGTGTVECTIPETPAHTHGEGCYGQRGPLVCELEERKPHTHDERCYDSKGNMTCTLPVTVAHTHDETCVTDTGEKVSVLTCDKPVHLHSDDCFAVEEEIQLEFLCDTGAHSHGESCYDGENVLTCTIPEHTHEAACLVVDLDLTADVETPEQWEAPLKELYRTGRWPEDLLAVAKTQLEYQESVKNCVLTDMQLKGYTRYGAWYGTPYGDWNTLFVFFCLDYARVEDFPTHEDRVQWMELLEEEELLRIPADYTPKPGDLVFLDQDQVADAPVEIPVIADLVGIVEEILPATEEEPIRLKFIAGDVNNKVDYVTCPLEDITIVGYAELPPEAEKESEEIQDVRQLTYEGEDYTVTVSFTAEAQLPENVQLDVREILAGTEEYDQYYQQSVAMIQGDTQQPEAVAEEESTDSDLPQETESVIEELIEKIIDQEPEETTEEASEEEQKPEVTFARFFDIHFVSEGTVLEPAAPVDIHIQYHQGIVQQDQRKGVAVHFAETGTEILDAETVWNDNSQVESFSFTQNSFSVSGTVLVAEPRAAGTTYYIWLDGTCGGHAAYTGAVNKVETTNTGTFTLPLSFDSPTTYNYKLKGWYDVTNGKYYPPGKEVTDITGNMVFYADWIAANYNFGEDNVDVADTKDTSEFVTIDVFDYNHLFNINSSTVEFNINGSRQHTESWTHVESNANAIGEDSLNFSFVDSNGERTEGRLANTKNRNDISNWTGSSAVETGIMPQDRKTDDTALLDALFDKDETVIGKTYLGSGNHLFQYDENTGYYYYNSENNAAAYNQGKQRFYVYGYKENASSSSSNDFLPLNAPYAKDNPQDPEEKIPNRSQDGNYTYHTTVHNDLTTVNFFFGMKTNIHFYLPNAVGLPVDEHGNPGNLDTNGNEMLFSFSGDDDVWIYVDDKLVLDLGGIHLASDGSINFSTGEIKVNGEVLTQKNEENKDEDVTLMSLFEDSGGLGEGGHNLTIYYLERGAGESNCSINFNLAPRYQMVLYKQDYYTRENLDDVTFGIYMDEACEEPARLWDNHQKAKEEPDKTKYQFTTQDGFLQFFGLVAGKTYYIKEETPPKDYSATDDLVRITLNNHGVDISEATMLSGVNGERTQGYELVSHHLDEASQTIELILTNRRAIASGQSTKNVRVTKQWVNVDDESDIPNTITVYLTKNEQRYGHSMTLGKHNGWAYTWTGLPDDGSEYEVNEDLVPGFVLLDPASTLKLRNGNQQYTINWLKVGALEDGISYMLKLGNGYLSQSNGNLQILSLPSDEEIPDSVIWTSRAVEEGFRLSNGGYALTLEEDQRGAMQFKARTVGTGNQIIYCDGDGLFVKQNGILYYLAASQTAVTTSPVSYALDIFKQEKIPVDVIDITLINSKLDAKVTTYLTVKKEWVSKSDTWNQEVTIHLLKDGEDSGIVAVLNRHNGFTYTFAGLPVGPEYSVKEAPLAGYTVEYSDKVFIPGSRSTDWINSGGILAERDEPYLISNNSGYLLSVNDNNQIVSQKPDQLEAATDNQKWIRTGQKLLNVGTGMYLRYANSQLSLTDQAQNATDVSMSGNKLKISNRYLQLNNGSVSIKSSSYSGTALTLYYGIQNNVNDGYEITVTNTQVIEYLLPHTGGLGINTLQTYGFLLSALALGFFFYRRRRGACDAS